MKPRGLPDLDVPFHDQEPNPCSRCKHAYFAADDKALRYRRCDRSNQQCRYERHETGECGPAAIYWKARADV